MKKLRVFGVSLILLSLFFVSLVYAVRINEVELNPSGTDSGNEWVELYSESEINLGGWKLINNDNKEINLSQSFQGYLIINFSGQWLDNSNESLKLFDGSSLVDSTSLFNDDSNDNRAWQYCDGDWSFAIATKNSVNSCGSQNQSQNNTNQNSQEKISLETEWEENEIVNGEEFGIKIKAYNLKDRSYNLKVWIEFEDNDTIISERYDEENGEWKSGTYYVDNFFSGIGNKSENMKLRVKEDYRKFFGTALLKAKIESEEFIFEKNIKVLEEERPEEKKDENKTDTKVTTALSVNQTQSIIKLGRSKEQNATTKDKQDKVKVIYESSGEKIKKYAIYALNVVLIVIIVLLIKKKV